MSDNHETEQDPVDASPEAEDAEEISSAETSSSETAGEEQSGDEQPSADETDASDSPDGTEEVAESADSSADSGDATEGRADDASVGAEESSEPIDDLFLSPDDSDGEVVYDESEVEVVEPAVEPAQPAEPAVSSAELEELREALAAVEKERDEAKERMVRTAADLENFRKRTLREKEEQRKYGIDKVVLELLPVLDNLNRALEHADKSADSGSIVDGIRMVQKQFVSALQKHGVQGFDSVGEAFDPQRHEAIQQVETTEHETGTVLEQYQRGYMLHERLIRPAMVVVARKLEAPAEPEAPDVVDEDSEVVVEVVEEPAAELAPEAPAEPSDEKAAEPAPEQSDATSEGSESEESAVH